MSETAGPFAVIVGEHACALRQAARDGEDERHGHVGGVFGQRIRRVRHRDALAGSCLDIDIVDAIGKAGDQLQLRPGLLDQRGIDSVGHRWHQNVGALHGGDQFRLRAGAVIEIEFGVEKLAHARLDGLGQLARDVDLGLFFLLSSAFIALFRGL